jgi:putative ABC transport system ATP-binding protein
VGIQLENVSKIYPAKADGKGAIRALDNVSIEVGAGEWLAVMGPSGSGKTSLVNIVGCLDRASSGEVRVNDENLSALSQKQLDRFRAEKIGLVFQQFHLIPYLTALENVMLAQYFHSMTDEQEALAALARVGLKDRAHHLPAHLSGGEQQRVCIARALINDPKILLADEPTGNLDAVNEEIVLRLLRDFHRQGRTIVMVTHDPTVARLADRRIELHHGRIVDQEIYTYSDERQFDEVLEEIWSLRESGEIPDVTRLQAPGALPPTIAVEKMVESGLLEMRERASWPGAVREVSNPCHELLHTASAEPAVADGTNRVIAFTPKGEQRAANVIRRHRLAERLFTETLHIENEREIEEQACKFEHILSYEATDKICAFLGHPKTCPHGSPIPPGCCCTQAVVANLQEEIKLKK